MKRCTPGSYQGEMVVGVGAMVTLVRIICSGGLKPAPAHAPVSVV